MKKFINTDKEEYIIDRLIPSGAILLIILIWEYSVRYFKIPDYILPSPSLIIKVFESTWRLLLSHTEVTLYEAFLGFIISIATGLLLSFLMIRWKIIKKILYPLMVISQTIPIIALAPVIIIWLGVGTFPKIVIVVLVCFFPVCISTYEGLLSTDRDMLNLMKVMGAGHLKMFWDVRLPSALPQFFSGLKIAATYSIMGAVVGEWLGAKSGLGIFMTRAMSSFRTDMLFAAIAVVAILSIFVFKLVEVLEKIIIPWNFKKS